MRKKLTQTASLLVIDDEPEFLEMLKENLDLQFDNVKYENSALSALKLFQNQKFDAVICDYKMPVMDGLKFVDELNRINLFVPILVQSGAYEDKELLKAMDEGKIFDIIPKPSPLEVIHARIRNAIIMSHYIDLAWSTYVQSVNQQKIDEFLALPNSKKNEFLAAFIAVQNLKSLNAKAS
jgi:CheY-like chemotaxis protein